jgi:hypothetical protein
LYRFVPTARYIKNLYVTVDTAADSRPPDSQPNAGDYETHLYPFEELLIRSHVRPHFVLFELGRRLDAVESIRDSDLGFIYTQHKRACELIREIYSAWTTRISEEEEEEHPEFFQDVAQEEVAPNRDRSSSVMTEAWRG